MRGRRSTRAGPSSLQGRTRSQRGRAGRTCGSVAEMSDGMGTSTLCRTVAASRSHRGPWLESGHAHAHAAARPTPPGALARPAAPHRAGGRPRPHGLCAWRCRRSSTGTCASTASRRSTPSGCRGWARAAPWRWCWRAVRVEGGRLGRVACPGVGCSRDVRRRARLDAGAGPPGRDRAASATSWTTLRVHEHRAGGDRLPGDAGGVRQPDLLRRRAAQLAGAHRRPPAGRAGLLRRAGPARASPAVSRPV